MREDEVFPPEDLRDLCWCGFREGSEVRTVVEGLWGITDREMVSSSFPKIGKEQRARDGEGEEMKLHHSQPWLPLNDGLHLFELGIRGNVSESRQEGKEGKIERRSAKERRKGGKAAGSEAR